MSLKKSVLFILLHYIGWLETVIYIKVHTVKCLNIYMFVHVISAIPKLFWHFFFYIFFSSEFLHRWIREGGVRSSGTDVSLPTLAIQIRKQKHFRKRGHPGLFALPLVRRQQQWHFCRNPKPNFETGKFGVGSDFFAAEVDRVGGGARGPLVAVSDGSFDISVLVFRFFYCQLNI